MLVLRPDSAPHSLNCSSLDLSLNTQFLLSPAKSRGMAVQSNFLGSVTVTGDDAKALTRKLSYGRGTQAAVQSALNGRQLATAFAQRGSVTINLNPVREHKPAVPEL